jgi:hypothetical protein
MEEAKVLIELAKLSLSRYDERRKYEWRVSFAFWALIVGAMIKKKELMIPLPGQYWILIVAGVLYAFLWLRNVWVADENDKCLGFYYRDEAFSVLRDKNHKISSPPKKISYRSLIFWFGFLKDWATWSHIIVTLALMALFVSVR